MSQAVKKELIQTLDRLSLEKLLAVLHFAQRIEQQAPEQVVASVGVSAEEAARAMADFFAADKDFVIFGLVILPEELARFVLVPS